MEDGEKSLWSHQPCSASAKCTNAMNVQLLHQLLCTGYDPLVQLSWVSGPFVLVLLPQATTQHPETQRIQLFKGLVKTG